MYFAIQFYNTKRGTIVVDDSLDGKTTIDAGTLQVLNVTVDTVRLLGTERTVLRTEDKDDISVNTNQGNE